MTFIAAPVTAHADSPLKASSTAAGSDEAADTVRRRAFALLPGVQTELLLFSPISFPAKPGWPNFAPCANAACKSAS